MVMRFMFSSFIFLKCSKTVNLLFALESEIKLSVESESQSSERDLSTLLPCDCECDLSTLLPCDCECDLSTLLQCDCECDLSTLSTLLYYDILLQHKSDF